MLTIGDSKNRRQPVGDGRNIKHRPSAPLEGVTICLTGLNSERKTKIHNLVVKLGGKFIRDLVTQSTTHLIAERPEGEKYKESLRCNHICIVRPEWIEMCAKTMSKVDVSSYLLENFETSTFESTSFTLYQQCQELLLEGVLPPNALFSTCSFLLLGFPAVFEKNDTFVSRDTIDVQTGRMIRNELSRLIRRCMGTIYWEPNDFITHVIVSEYADGKTRAEASLFSINHRNKPYMVSTEWIMSSIKNKKLMDPALAEFKPKEKKLVLKKKQPSSIKSTKAGIFDGLYFHLSLPSPLSPDHAMILTYHNAERLILSQGGVLLYKSGIQVLKKDTHRVTDKRCFYVHLSGTYNEKLTMKSDILLTQISMNKLCQIVPVNPIWLLTCDTCQQFIETSSCADLFSPKLLPLKKLPDDNHLIISVSGFIGPQRQALKHLIIYLGAEYSESLSHRNTHLICLEESGAKYLKALEWKIKVVNVNWLIKVAERGYTSED